MGIRGGVSEIQNGLAYLLLVIRNLGTVLTRRCTINKLLRTFKHDQKAVSYICLFSFLNVSKTLVIADHQDSTVGTVKKKKS